MKRGSPQTFEAFCREAVDFLKSSATPHPMIGGIAVGAIGEPRLTGDVDVIGYMGMDKALALIDAAVAACAPGPTQSDNGSPFASTRALSG